MTRRHLLRRLLCVAAAATLIGLAGCGNEEPPVPVTPTVDPPVPPSGPSVTLVGLEVAGPESIDPGATAQFKATAHYSDGSTQDRTAEASWKTSDESVLAISAAGTAVARARGESSVTAAFGGRSAVKPEVLVLPQGTYRLRGLIRDAGLEVDDARVTVTENAAEGLTVITRRGEYRLYGIAGVADIVVTADGYVPIEHRVNVTGHQTLDFVLIPLNPRSDPDGTYTLRVTAAESCRSVLPASFLVRSYQATVRRDGSPRRLQVVLGGAEFYRLYGTYPPRNYFDGTLEPDALKFQPSSLACDYCDLPSIVEVVPPQSWYSFSGSVTLTPSLRGFAGTLDGEIVQLFEPFWFKDLLRCHSRGHRVELIQ